jgi:hypothetical protein
VGACLPGYHVSQFPQRLGQFRAADVPRRFHRARSSSRTKCSRIIPGACAGSSK